MNCIEFKDKGFEREFKKIININVTDICQDDLLRINGIIISEVDSSLIRIPWQSNSPSFAMTIPIFCFNINDSENNLWEEDLVNFSHIISLHLKVQIENLSWLNGFKNLRELYVEKSSYKEWSFLTNLKRLKFLSVKDCQFSDLTPIQNLYLCQFEEFELTRKNVTQFNSFEGLQHLELINCGISDIKPLTQCGLITELNLSHNDIIDITPLTGIRHLYYLTLRYNYIKDIYPLRYFKSIYYINLRHNKITNIEVFESSKLENLSRLYLEDNLITDFSPVRQLNLVHHDIDQYRKYKKVERSAKIKSRKQNKTTEKNDVSEIGDENNNEK